jgi:hypothetical protein
MAGLSRLQAIKKAAASVSSSSDQNRPNIDCGRLQDSAAARPFYKHTRSVSSGSNRSGAKERISRCSVCKQPGHCVTSLVHEHNKLICKKID